VTNCYPVSYGLWVVGEGTWSWIGLGLRGVGWAWVARRERYWMISGA